MQPAHGAAAVSRRPPAYAKEVFLIASEPTTPLPPTTVAAALAQAQAGGLPRLEAQWLLLATLRQAPAGRAWLVREDGRLLSPDEQQEFARLCQQREAGVPLSYLTGHKAFYGLDLQVDDRVLDPRGDTETLVDWALELLPPQASCRVADLGTGSGAIALALAQQRPQATVWATDASADALAVAAANAQRLQLPLTLRQGHWLRPLAGQHFDLMASNPPYIAADDPHLPALQHEPREALVSGIDGLDDLRVLCARAPAHLLPGGWLLLEHGHDQAAAVRALLRQAGLQQVQSRRDLAGIERCSGGRKPAAGASDS